jgi:hypothetical protein
MPKIDPFPYVLTAVGKHWASMRFFMGTHIVSHIDKTDVPLFVSYRQLNKRKRKPFDQKGMVCVDSGGFSELQMYGKWKTTPEQYIEGLERLQTLGLKITWASQQDWMVESFMLDKTGKTIEEHQKLTVQNYLDLQSLKPTVHIIPVLQGQTLQDYFNHFEMFECAGVDLRSEPVVGVGSVCRRQGTDEIGHLMKCLSAKGLKLHGFGVKKNGIKKYAQYLTSADSMAWSFNARYDSKCCDTKAKNCANCLKYALKWRGELVD